MIKANEMTQKQALLGILVLSLTAKTDENAKKAGDLADQIANGLTDAEIELCKNAATDVWGLLTNVFYAVSPLDEESLAAVEAGGNIGVSEFNGGESIFVFETEKDRDLFCVDVTEAYEPDVDVVCTFLVQKYQLKLEAGTPRNHLIH